MSSVDWTRDDGCFVRNLRRKEPVIRRKVPGRIVAKKVSWFLNRCFETSHSKAANQWPIDHPSLYNFYPKHQLRFGREEFSNHHWSYRLQRIDGRHHQHLPKVVGLDYGVIFSCSSKIIKMMIILQLEYYS